MPFRVKIAIGLDFRVPGWGAFSVANFLRMMGTAGGLGVTSRNCKSPKDKSRSAF